MGGVIPIFAGGGEVLELSYSEMSVKWMGEFSWLLVERFDVFGP